MTKGALDSATVQSPLASVSRWPSPAVNSGPIVVPIVRSAGSIPITALLAAGYPRRRMNSA